MNTHITYLVLKMLYKKFYQVFFFLVICTVQAQNHKKLFFESEYANKIKTKIFNETKMDSMIFIYQGEFVKGQSLVFDRKLMEETINKRIPNKNQTGYAVLDWEGEATHILYGFKKVSDAKYVAVRMNYIASIKYAKKLRPNMKWAFYNFPFLNYVQKGELSEGYDDFVRKKIMPILNTVDFFTPSLYILKDERTLESDNLTFSYAKSNTEYAIKLGKELKKPVYPVIWNRYLSQNRNSALIELPYFEKFVKTIIDTQYNGKEIDGIIWWNCEDYVFNHKSELKSTAIEYSKVKDKDKHINAIFHTYYERIIKNLNK